MRRWSTRLALGLVCILGLVVGGGLAEREGRATATASSPRVDDVVATSNVLDEPPREEHPWVAPDGAAEPTSPVPAPAPLDPADRFPGAVARSFGGGRIITGSTPHRIVLFTFDDGPDRRTTPRLLRHLDEVGVRGIFFVTSHRLHNRGPRAEAERAIVRDIAARGHILANHSTNHPQLPLLETPEVMRELAGPDEIFRAEVGDRSWLVRPPGGSRSPRIDRLIAGSGYTQVLWNLGTGDHQVRDADAVLDTFVRVLERREREAGDRGGIVLLHDTHDWSVEAFPRIVSWLRQRNCTLLDEGEELFDIVDDLSFFYEVRDESDASALASPARLDPAILAVRQARLREETARRCRTLAAL